MITYQNNLARKIWLCFWGFSFTIATFLISSCTSDDDLKEEGTYSDSKEVLVSLNIYSTNDKGFQVSRADENSVEGEEGEFISTLRVFIVDDEGKIESKLMPDLSEDTEAKEGNLNSWSSYTTLSQGKKTIYAFANWETADSEDGDWAKLIQKEEGEYITEDDLNFLIDNPAGKIDIENGKFIPMSAKKVVEVTDSYEDISVGLDRLVGKVYIDINSTQEEDLIATLIFSGLADKVSLLSDETTTYNDITFEDTVEVNFETTLTGDEDIRIASFYVNETSRADDGFTIYLNTNRYGGLDYTATTVTKEILRNHIYPLTLNLDGYSLELTPRAWTSVLGYVGELEYTEPIYFTNNTYYITMLDVTSSFEITPSLVKSDDETQEASWNWTPQNTDDAVYTTEDGVLTATSLTATIGYEYSFKLDASWNPNESTTNTRSYSIKVVFTEGFPTFYYRSRAWKSLHYQNELVNLISRK